MLKIYMKDHWPEAFARQKELGIRHYHETDSIKSLALEDILTREDPSENDHIKVEIDLTLPLGGCFSSHLNRKQSEDELCLPDTIVDPTPCRVVTAGKDDSKYLSIAPCSKEEDERLILIVFPPVVRATDVEILPSHEGTKLATVLDAEDNLLAILFRMPQEARTCAVDWIVRDFGEYSVCGFRQDDKEVSAAKKELANLKESAHPTTSEHWQLLHNIINKYEENLKFFGYLLSSDETYWYLTDPDGFCQKFSWSPEGIDFGVDVAERIISRLSENVERFVHFPRDMTDYQTEKISERLEQKAAKEYYRAHQQGLPGDITIVRQTNGDFRSHGWVIRPDGTLRLPDASITIDNDELLKTGGFSERILPLFGVKYIDYWVQIFPGELVLKVDLPEPVTTYDAFTEDDQHVRFTVVYCKDNLEVTGSQLSTVEKLRKYAEKELFANLRTTLGSVSLKEDIKEDLAVGWTPELTLQQ